MAATRLGVRLARDLRLRSAGGALLALVLVAGWLPLGAAPASAAGGWTWPLAPRPVVVRGFDRPAGPYAAGHRGVDLASQPGSPVLAAGPGIVVFAGRVAGRGVVSVDHEDGLRTTYEPVAADVSRGDPVTAGTVLGRLELTASHCLPTACLHWGLRRGSLYLDPLSLLGPVHVRLLPVWSAGAPAADLGGVGLPTPTVASRALGAESTPASGRATQEHSGGPPLTPTGPVLIGGMAATVGLGAAVGLARRRAPP